MSSSSSFDNTSSLLTERYPLPMHLYGRFMPNFLLFDRLATPVWYALGLFGNTLSAIVWLSPEVRRNNSSAVYLAALSIWDLAFLLLHTFQELKEVWNVTLQNVFTCSLLPVLLLTAQYLSPLLVLGFTVERWVSVCFPFRRESLCTPRRAGVVVGAMTTGVALWNLWQLHFKDGCEVRGDGWGWPVYTLATEILISGLVPGSALVFNLLVVREIRRISAAGAVRKRCGGDERGDGDGGDGGSERRFRTTTATLLCVSFFVILTSLPAGLIYGLQTVAEFGRINMTDAQVLSDPVWQRHFVMARAKKVIDEISLSHYSLNFFIYLITGPQYRRQVRDLFGRLRRHSKFNGGTGSAAAAAATIEERRLSNASLRRSRRAAGHMTVMAVTSIDEAPEPPPATRIQREGGGAAPDAACNSAPLLPAATSSI